jgi:hypothetical protein
MSGMSGTALNAASSGLTVLSLLLPDFFEHPTTLMARRTRRIPSAAALFICNALCKSASTVAPVVVVLEGSFEAYEKFHRTSGYASGGAPITTARPRCAAATTFPSSRADCMSATEPWL